MVQPAHRVLRPASLLIVTSFIDGAGRGSTPTCSRNYTSRCTRETAGARAAILGSIWVIGLTAVLAIPLGVAAGVYLEEFADQTRWYNRLIEVNIQNLAAVPAIIYGMLALGVLSLAGLQPGPSSCGGAIALALLILPVIIIATREALRAVPQEIRDGSLALGATPWQTVLAADAARRRPRHRHRHDPGAVPGARRGRAAAAARRPGLRHLRPQRPDVGFTTLPIQIFNWAGSRRRSSARSPPRRSSCCSCCCCDERRRDLHPQPVPEALVTHDMT